MNKQQVNIRVPFDRIVESVVVLRLPVRFHLYKNTLTRNSHIPR